jgi:hypothetical protein
MDPAFRGLHTRLKYAKSEGMNIGNKLMERVVHISHSVIAYHHLSVLKDIYSEYRRDLYRSHAIDDSSKKKVYSVRTLQGKAFSAVASLRKQPPRPESSPETQELTLKSYRGN